MTQAEKLIKIIINDSLKYLRLKERGLVAENCLKQQITLERREAIEAKTPEEKSNQQF